MRNIRYYIFISCIITVTALSSALNCHAIEMPFVERYVLDNGMTFLLIPRQSSSISFEVKVKAGSIDEETGKTGLSHMLEHMMFKGTDNIGTTDYSKEKKLLDEMDAIALKLKMAPDDKKKTLQTQMDALIKKASELQIPGELDKIYSLAGEVGLNASTSADLTSYHITLPADRLELWAAIESRRMTNPVFREFYTEREVVLKERSQRVDLSDEGTLFEKFLLHSFEALPYRYPVIGFRKDVEGLTRTDLEEYYFKYYVPNNMVVAISGGFSSDEAKLLLKKYFGGIPRKDIIRTLIEDEPARRAQARIRISSKEQPFIMIGVIKPKLPSIDDTCFDVIENVLTGGETSRLVKALVKKGLASGVDTYNGLPGSRLDNLFLISATPIKPNTNKNMEDVIWEEIEKLKDKGITDEELSRAARVIKKSVLASMLTDAGAASVLSTYESIAGDWMYIYKNLSVLESIKPEQVKDCARKYLIRQNAATALLEE